MDIKKAQELVKKSPTLETFNTIQKAAETATKDKDAALARKYSDLLEAVFVQLTKGNSDRAFEEFDFAENQLAKLDVQGQQDLIDLIDEVYQDGIEKLVAASLDSRGDIRVVFEDVNGRTIRRFVGKIADPDSNLVISYKLANESSASFSEYDFAAKPKGKKKNCTAGKSIACGASCISAKKTCRSEAPVSDKAKAKARSVKAKLSGDAPAPKPDQSPKDTIPDLETAKRQFRSLGSGIDGEVFLDTSTDPPRALKYRSNQTAPEYERDVLDNLKMAGELGISPRLLGEYPDRKAFAMEFLEGFTPGIHPRSDDDDDFSVANDKDLLPYDRAFLRTLKVAHDNNLVVDDLHADNVMVNGTTGQTRFIDQGGIKRGTNEEIADQLLNRYSWRPLVAETIDRMSGSALNAAAKRELRAIQRSWNNRDEKPLSEAEYGQMISRVYALLGVD